MYCTIRVAKTKVLISFAVSASLFSLMQKAGFSHDEAQIQKKKNIDKADNPL